LVSDSPDSFSKLVDEHREAFLSWAVNIGNEPDTVKDFVQETCLQLRVHKVICITCAEYEKQSHISDNVLS